MHNKVAIVPVVSKADCLTLIELAEQLHLIRARLAEANIQYFDFGESDINEDWLTKPFDRHNAFLNLGSVMMEETPNVEIPVPVRPMVRNVFAVISNQRRYIYGTANPFDPSHSDTTRLHKNLFGSLGKLADELDGIHEAWRIDRVRQSESNVCMDCMQIVVAVVAFAVLLLYFNNEQLQEYDSLV